jgi:hypothetical protein
MNAYIHILNARQCQDPHKLLLEWKVLVPAASSKTSAVLSEQQGAERLNAGDSEQNSFDSDSDSKHSVDDYLLLDTLLNDEEAKSGVTTD